MVIFINRKYQMNDRSGLQINLHTNSQGNIIEKHLLEETAQYYLPASYPISQLVCLRLSAPQDPCAKITGKVSSITANSSFRFRFDNTTDGLILECIPSEPLPVEGASQTHSTVSDGMGNALSPFLKKAIQTIVQHQNADCAHIQINGTVQQIEQQIAIQMLQNMIECQRKLMRDHEEQRRTARHHEKRERTKEDVRKDEEKKQDLRLAIQKIEEPERQLVHLEAQKDEAQKSAARATRHRVN
jgi:hypothetical protein